VDWIKVSGCIADVRIHVALDEENRIQISGVSDAKVISGLLAVLCEVDEVVI
jgi:sulfur transfer protein SufE